MKSRYAKLVWFLAYAVILPVATYGGLLGYSSHPQHSPAIDQFAPTQMIGVLIITQLAAMSLLVLRERVSGINVIPNINLYFLSSIFLFVCLFFFLRINYSFYFLGVFLPVVWTWILFVYQVKKKTSPKPRYLVAQFGEWKSVVSTDPTVTIATKPNDIPLDQVDIIIIDDHAELPKTWQGFLSIFHNQGIGIVNISEFLEVVHGKVSMIHCSSEHFAVTMETQLYRFVKRMIDIFVSAAAILLFTPVVAICAVLISIDTKGAIIYRQTRTGKSNRPFTLYKLRTMYSDSETLGPRFAEPHDPRATPIGRWLRRFKLDELPQFLNVLIGNMSLIGPRPERPVWVDQYRIEIPYYDLRHLLRPGITGWAQVTHGYTSTVEGARLKLERDLYYVKHIGPTLDLKILIETIRLLYGNTRAA
jgi:UDP-GalNAc:undecaprenyl-phosphate GalNAc-1-phosphate transferase